MMLRVQKYDAEIKYVQGKNIPLADALSRVSPCPGDTIEGLDVSVHEVHLHLNASPTRIAQIKEETAKDETLLLLRSIVTQGWRDTRSGCPVHLQAFWNYCDELAVVTFHGKTYINAFPFNGLKRLLVVCLLLKQFRKSLEALERPLKFSL